jgi:23S rRNA (cytidine2498-2'-O)-methyltransferase
MTLMAGVENAILVSTSSEYPQAAMAELRPIARGGRIERLGDDLLRVQTTAGIAAMAAAARSGDVVFVRQLSQEVAVLDGHDVADAETAVVGVIRALSDLVPIGRSSLRILAWSTGQPRLAFAPGTLAHRVVSHFRDVGAILPAAGQEWIATVVLAEDRVHVGWNRTDVALSDWAGGRVRLARSPEQISRAEFKLEELFQVFPPSVPRGESALDLGASPGGWTRIVRAHGLRVTAVDPGDLHPTVAADRQVTHARTTAGQFLQSTTETFDLIVNDMRMDAVRTADVMVMAHDRLRADGLVIVTFKLGVADPTSLLLKARQTLMQRYTIRFMRQLHHNRHEVTVVATPD